MGSFFSVANVIQQAGCPVPEYIKGFQKLLRYAFELTQSLLFGFYTCILVSLLIWSLPYCLYLVCSLNIYPRMVCC